MYGRKPEEAIDYCLENTIIHSSNTLLDEVIERLHRKAGAPYRFRNQLRARLEAICEVTEPGDLPAVVRDAKDNHIIATAIGSHSSYIVTGDEDLLMLGTYQGVEIVKPADFLKLLS